MQGAAAVRLFNTCAFPFSHPSHLFHLISCCNVGEICPKEWSLIEVVPVLILAVFMPYPFWLQVQRGMSSPAWANAGTGWHCVSPFLPNYAASLVKQSSQKPAVLWQMRQGAVQRYWAHAAVSICCCYFVLSPPTTYGASRSPENHQTITAALCSGAKTYELQCLCHLGKLQFTFE